MPTTVPPLKPIVGTKLYEIVAIDILELGLTSSGNRYVVTVIDSFSKWCSAYPVPSKSAPVIAQAFVENWLKREARFRKILLSNRGSEFENELFIEIR